MVLKNLSFYFGLKYKTPSKMTRAHTLTYTHAFQKQYICESVTYHVQLTFIRV